MTTRWNKTSLARRKPGERGTHVWLFAIGAAEHERDTIHAALPTLEHLAKFWLEVADGASAYTANGAVLSVRRLVVNLDCDRRELINLIAQASSEDDIARGDLHVVYWLGHANKVSDDDHILYLPRLEFADPSSRREVLWLRELAAHIGSISDAEEQCFFFDVCSTLVPDGQRPPFAALPRSSKGGTHRKRQAILVGSGHEREGISSPEGDGRPTLFAAALTRALATFGAAPNGLIRDLELFSHVVSSLIAEEWLLRGYRGFPDLTGVCDLESYFAHTLPPLRPFRCYDRPVRLGSSRMPHLHVLIGVKTPDVNAVLLKCRYKINSRADAVNSRIVWHGSISPSAPHRAIIKGKTIHEFVRCHQRDSGPVAVHQWFVDGDF